MKVCSPHCGAKPGSNSGGEVYERELLAALTPHVDVHLHPGRRGYRWWLAWAPWARTIGQCWQRERSDLLRAHSARFVGPACLLARRAYGVTAPLVVHHHHFDPGWRTAIDKWVLRRADLIITDSWFSWHQLEAWDAEVATGRAFVVRPGVAPLGAPVPITSRLDGSTVALFVGALKPRKNVAWLVRQFRYAPRHARLWIVGDGPERRAVELARGDDERVILFGHLSDDALLAMYAEADFFVFPSRLEGFGMPVATALACGLPCLVSDRGALPELVRDTKNGYVVPIDDTGGSWRARFAQLCDPVERAKVWPATLRHWTWADAAAEVAEYYGHGPQPPRV